jgi:hypothetical protein
MNKDSKHNYRAAVDIHQSITNVREITSLAGIDELFARYKRSQRLLEKATKRKWAAAADDAADQLRSALDGLRFRITRSIDDLTRHSHETIEPTINTIFRDLEGLRNEFECVTIDRGQQRLTVQTSCIELEGIYLGHFEIQLNWQHIRDTSPYNVIALDPNSPAANDSVTHPHVQAESLCEGEGADAIRRALDEGRLYDFFCIVDQILHSYNAGSAYVGLDEWDGVSCGSCGGNIHSDEVYCCHKCEADSCSECSVSCSSCSDGYCSDCVSSCHCCGDDNCSYCMKSCDDCGESFCNSCLFEGTCDDCIHQQNEMDQDAEVEAESSNFAV